MSSRAVSILLVTAGLLLLAVQAHRAPQTTLAATAAFAVVWLVRRRLIRKQHRHSTFHRIRREVVTNALVTVVLVTGVSLLSAALDVGTDYVPAAGTTGAPADQMPWAATFLLDGIVTVLAVSCLTFGVLVALRRAARRHHPAPPPAPLAG